MTLWTIGHSTRTLEEFIAALKAHEIDLLADVRSFPTSARHPHFDQKVLAAELPPAGIAYQELGQLLGGRRRKTRTDSPHTALSSAGFRNYADHMETVEFRQGVDKLLKLAENSRIAYMCAERLWWRCHRSLISDYLTAMRGVEVMHIHDEKKFEPHRMHRTARVVEDQLIYDVGESGRLL